MNIKLDCIIIGYNEVSFSSYEQFLHAYGEELKSGNIPNLAAAYLTSFLRRNGHTAEYINLFQYAKEQLIEYLRRDPLCVAISTTFYVVNLPVTEMVKFIREHNPKVKIVAGGPRVNNHARNYHGDALKTALEDMGADIYVLEGQGELTLARLIDCLKNGGSLNDVPNLACFENKELHHSTRMPEYNSLDANFIDWKDFIRSTRPDYYRSQMWYCEPGTPIQNERRKYEIEGEGFVWEHATMDSMEAMDHIDRMFLEINESAWLLKWGKGISRERFREFMSTAHRMLTLEIASVPAQQKKSLQRDYLQKPVQTAQTWT